VRFDPEAIRGRSRFSRPNFRSATPIGLHPAAASTQGSLRRAQSQLRSAAAMTEPFVADALVIAIRRRGKLDALLHRSDQGSPTS